MFGEFLMFIFIVYVFYVVFAPLFKILDREAKLEDKISEEIDKKFEGEEFIYDDTKSKEENMVIRNELFVKNQKAKNELLKQSMPKRSFGTNYYLYWWLPLAILGFILALSGN